MLELGGWSEGMKGPFGVFLWRFDSNPTEINLRFQWNDPLAPVLLSGPIDQHTAHTAL